MEGDVRDPVTVATAMEGVKWVYHLAAAGSVVESVADPVANFEANVSGTVRVLTAAREASVERVVFASTGGALIGDAQPPVDEQSLPKPISPYGASKLSGEAYCHAYARCYGLETVCLRFANVYGPLSRHKKGAITSFFGAIEDGLPMVIYGNGTASRDFLYVEDICRALELALEEDVEPGTVMHVASGVETRIDDLAKLCGEVAGSPAHPVEYQPARQGEVGRNFAAYELAAKCLGFEPQVELRRGLERTWRWFKHDE
jgi:UDP-glucose 4-epimerase